MHLSIRLSRLLAAAFIFAAAVSPADADEALALSVYATAGDVLHHLRTPDARAQATRVLRSLHVSRIFLEGRRGDEYVPAEALREIRAALGEAGFACSGGIATVPGSAFGTRQQGGLGWLNWESEKTQRDVAGFFTENAPVFEELIVDDFYCTGDESADSARARGPRSWSQYRRDLLVSLVEPLVVKPARAAHPGVRLILKYPQWYDRFHLFGYDPPRMSPPFDQVWVGTEVRDPQTRRMGFVQPTQGYINFRWLSSVAGPKVRGAWFDHIECSAQNFVDQAYLSVLAGARELTLFRLGDLMQSHPGDALLERRWPDLQELAGKVRGQAPAGLAYYKPPGSDADENLYLPDYLAMIGLPVVPVAQYPAPARAVFLARPAAADTNILDRMQSHLAQGGTVVLTPAFVRAAGAAAARLAGVEVGAASVPSETRAVRAGAAAIELETPLELDAAMKAADASVLMTAVVGTGSVPFLTRREAGRGSVLAVNLRTFSEQDFRDAGEWLLAPKRRGLPDIPEALANPLRAVLLAPLGIAFEAPAGVGLFLFGGSRCLYNFRGQEARVRLEGQALTLPAHGWRWR
jgi:hypothetical protein